MTIPLVLHWSGDAGASCEFHLHSPEELRLQLAALGIHSNAEGLITGADRNTPVGKVIHSLTNGYGVAISLDLDRPGAAAAYVPETRRLQIAPPLLQVILETKGQGVPHALLHEAHHVRTFQGGTVAREIRGTWLQITSEKTEAYRKYQSLAQDYPDGFAFDEIAAYKKDVLMRRRHLGRNDSVTRKSLEKFERYLEEFSLMTLDMVILLEDFLASGRNPSLTRKKERSVFSFSKETGFLAWDRFDLVLPQNHRFDLSRPREVIRLYAAELRKLAEDGLNTARATETSSRGFCILDSMSIREVSKRFAEIGIRMNEDGTLTALDRSTRVSRILGKITRRFKVKVSLFHTDQGAGSYFYGSNTITLGKKAVSAIFESSGHTVPHVLMHEIHHLNTARNASPEDQIKMSFVLMTPDLIKVNDWREEYPLIQKFYENEFAVDELLAYRKDLIRKASELRRGILVDLDSFRKGHEALREFVAVSEKLLSDIDDLLRTERFPAVIAVRPETVLILSPRFRIRLPKDHDFDIRRPREFLRLYAAELRKHQRASHSVLEITQPLITEVP